MNTPFLGGRVGGAMAAAITLAAAPATRGQELYLTYGFNKPILARIDGPTGKVLEETPILGASGLGRGLAVRWDGILYTFDADRLFRIDPKTGQGQVIGEPLPWMRAIAADPATGRLYGASETDLYQLDHKTGEATFIGTMEDPELFGVVFSMAIGRDGFLYVTDYPDVSLLRVDLQTAETTFICDLGSMSWYEDIGFDENGLLWASFEFDGGIWRDNIDICESSRLYERPEIDGLEVVPGGPPCYPDGDGDGALTLFDFLWFINAFNAENPFADCNGNGDFDLFDFLCFVNSFNAGC